MIHILYTFLALSNAFSTEVQGCGVYSFSGFVVNDKRSFSIMINKDTYSAKKIILGDSDVNNVMPFFDRSVKGKIRVTKIDGSYFHGEHLSDLEVIHPNMVMAQKENLSLLEKKECKK